MSDVIVAGGGIIGLTAAVRLLERGARVTVLAPDPPERTVSAVAAAVWFPARTGFDPRVLAWAAGAYRTFARQAADGVPGVALVATRNLARAEATEPPWWAPAAGGVTLAAGPAPWAGEVRFTAPLVEMDTYLPWLAGRVAAAGGRFVRHRLARLGDALGEAPVVVNATGLAAGALCGDGAVYPARGRIVVVANPGIHVSTRDEAGPTYVHPRSRDVVLGGTFEPGQWDTGPDPAASAAIARRCTALVPELAGAPVLRTLAGLRPCRRGGPRVAAQTVGGTRLVHAYGHGGAGVTLSWGCADEVAALALAA